MPERPIIIATRGSALALAQANLVFDGCRRLFPRLVFEIKIIKTTGDKLQSASLAQAGRSLPKGLFTKELEVALLREQADLAVHSLKDVPTELPGGLALSAVLRRADPRDVMVFKIDAGGEGGLPQLARGALVATGSPRREAQLREARPDLRLEVIRGNVVTRLEKLAESETMDATVLAAAGLGRLNFRMDGGRLIGDAVPDGLRAEVLEPGVMLPCPGQAAIGIEVRAEDERIGSICERLNHFNSRQAVSAERALLQAMGGGCSSAVGALATIDGERMSLRAVSFMGEVACRFEACGDVREPVGLGEEVASHLGSG
jgi:hydroxymethylbilane synthase